MLLGLTEAFQPRPLSRVHQWAELARDLPALVGDLDQETPAIPGMRYPTHQALSLE
jgi:hypothetical protein